MADTEVGFGDEGAIIVPKCQFTCVASQLLQRDCAHRIRSLSHDQLQGLSWTIDPSGPALCGLKPIYSLEAAAPWDPNCPRILGLNPRLQYQRCRGVVSSTYSQLQDTLELRMAAIIGLLTAVTPKRTHHYYFYLAVCINQPVDYVMPTARIDRWQVRINGSDSELL